MNFNATLKKYPIDIKEKAIERASIMEFDAGLSRYEAELQALRICGIENPEPIEDVLSVEACLTACRNSAGTYKPYRPGEDYQKRRGFWNDLNVIKDLQNGNGDLDGIGKGESFNLFRFEPGVCGLCAIDLDRHEGQPDGVENFKSILPASNLPDYLRDIENGSHPAYVKTPSNGYHLYFKTLASERFKHMEIIPSVELFHFGNMVNAPGSIKNGKSYKLYGSLQSAPLLPGFIRKRVLEMSRKSNLKPKPFFTYNRKVSRPELNKIMEWASDSNKITGRNRLSFEFAFRAARYGYSEYETESFLNNHPATSGHKQIRNAVRSAYKRQGAVSGL